MKLLELLERIGEMPAEIWLIPPVLILALMAAIGWMRRALLLRRYRAIAGRTGLTVNRSGSIPLRFAARFAAGSS